MKGTQRKIRKSIVLLGSVLLVSSLAVIFCLYVFIYTPLHSIPPQVQLREREEVRKSIVFLADRWHVPADNLIVLSATREQVLVIDTITYASGEILVGQWKDKEKSASFNEVDLVTEHIPESIMERLMIKNFYVFGGYYAEQAIIEQASAGFPIGRMSVRSNVYPEGIVIYTVFTVPWRWYLTFY